MKTKLMAAVAVLSIMTASGVARADDVTTLKQEAAALKKQNEALEQRLNKLEKQQQAIAAAPGAPASTDFMAQVTKGPIDYFAGDGPLTWHGITFFGTIDAGLGYASNGLPINSKFYQGSELVNQRAHAAYFGIVPNGLSTSTLGVKGTQELFSGVSGVFMASTNINPQSGQLANGPGSLVDQNGVNRNAQTISGSGSRGGQAFNDQLYAGISTKEFGELTFGRHRTLLTDLAIAYDPAASNAFSLIGYSGTYAAGLGNTANSRVDDALKYKIVYGPVRFGAMYKFADGVGGSNTSTATTAVTSPVYATKNDAGQIDLGASYGGFDIDGVLGYFHQSVFDAALSPTQLAGTSTFVSNMNVTTTSVGANANTLAASIADTTGGAVAAKYTWNQFKFYAGWSHAILHNPSNNVGIGGQNDQGGYTLSSVNNYAYPNAKLLDTFWGGVKYAYDPKTDFTVAYYHAMQNGYGTAANLETCNLPGYLPNGGKIGTTTYAAQSAPRSSTCSGTLDAVSTFVDYHFTKRFDVYGGIMYSVVGGGIASGYYNVNNWAPTAGARFTF